jgi:glycosyltransferase involved in cell wall biosynthesis
MQGYFGVSSLEGLSQGKPVIAGLDKWNIEHIKAFTGSDMVPWVMAANQDDLRQKLEQLIEDIELRERIGARSRRFMKRSWTEQRVSNLLCGVYQDA